MNEPSSEPVDQTEIMSDSAASDSTRDSGSSIDTGDTGDEDDDCTDMDGDGFCAETNDCDDGDPAVNT